MCVTIPQQVKTIKGTKATVQCGDHTHELDTRLLPDLKKGDWVMSENNFAAYKIDKEDAQERLKLLKELPGNKQ